MSSGLVVVLTDWRCAMLLSNLGGTRITNGGDVAMVIENQPVSYWPPLFENS